MSYLYYFACYLLISAVDDIACNNLNWRRGLFEAGALATEQPVRLRHYSGAGDE